VFPPGHDASYRAVRDVGDVRQILNDLCYSVWSVIQKMSIYFWCLLKKILTKFELQLKARSGKMVRCHDYMASEV